jgi:2-amino-4-hydroxy-6-hydroxymethyldihydropteridine diphosphokinase
LGEIGALSPILATPALGPAGRAFANAAVLVTTDLSPDALLAQLMAIERSFGRRPGRRWGPRVLDLDIILWSQGPWRSRGLTLPHPQMLKRRFVMDPLVAIAPQWRVPPSCRSVRQLARRRSRPC